MRIGGHRREVRGSALWGSGKRGTGSRGNALCGSAKRRTALLATLTLTLVIPLAASALPASPQELHAGLEAASWAENAEADPEGAELNLIDPSELDALLAGTLDP